MQTIYAHWGPETASRLRVLDRRHDISDAACEMFFFETDPSSRVFYDRDFISRKWGKWMDLVTYEERFHNYQAAMLLAKPRAG